MRIIPANEMDYAQMTLVHERAFPGFFLTSLGKGFLLTYYKAVLKSEKSIAVCAVDESENIIGFASGCIVSSNFHRNLFNSNRLSFLLAVVKSAFGRPGVFYRLARNLEKNANYHDDNDYAELLSIAVLPESKGSGIGKKLLESFEAEVKRRGEKKLALTTDFENNETVVNFYQKCGYTIFYDFVTYPNRRMFKMIKVL
jgi:ribosomal protein S18 acetylase RimI-like enzyme